MKMLVQWQQTLMAVEAISFCTAAAAVFCNRSHEVDKLDNGVGKLLGFCPV
jgi:hypothetical protein